MSLQKVKPGDPLVIPAGAYNTFVDAARDYLDRRQDQGQEARPSARHSGIVLVRNDSGEDVTSRFAILGIDGPVITPSDNVEEFKVRVVLSGVIPWVATHAGRFVVLLEPLVSGATGVGLVAGACPAQVYVNDEGHQFADVQNQTWGYLWSGTSGAAQILWKESGTGVKWAIVRLATYATVKETRFGYPTQAYSSGATITLNPCDAGGTDNGEANVAVEAGWSLPANTTIPTSVIIPFIVGDDSNFYVLGDNPREVVTDIQYDTSSHKLQKKVRMTWGAFTTTESPWLDITTAVDCTA